MDDLDDWDDTGEVTQEATVEQMIEECEDQESQLSDWARGFIDSIKRQYNTKGTLSEKQIKKLEEIWEKLS